MEKFFLQYLSVHWGDLIELIKEKYVLYTLSKIRIIYKDLHFFSFSPSKFYV